MGRNAKFDDEEFIRAALVIVSEEGPGGLTASAISKKTGAPIGSVYHRFPSLDHIAARLWLDIVGSFQDGFLGALERGDGRAAALHTPRWAREHVSEGRVLLLFRREEVMGTEWPVEVRERAAALAHQLDEGFQAFVRRRFGSITKDTMRTARFALIDVPYAAVKRHLEAGEMPPEIVDRLIEKTYHCVMGGNDENLERT